MAADRQVFEDELGLLLGAHRQGAAQAARNRETSTHPKLKHMVSAGTKANLTQAERLEQVFASIGATPRPRHDTGMQGICDTNEAEIASNRGAATRDLINIAYGRVAAHFYIAKYGTLRSTARALGCDRAVKLLSRTLVETHAIDREFTRLYDHLVARPVPPHYPGESAVRATAAMHPAMSTVTIVGLLAVGALLASPSRSRSRVG